MRARVDVVLLAPAGVDMASIVRNFGVVGVRKSQRLEHRKSLQTAAPCEAHVVEAAIRAGQQWEPAEQQQLAWHDYLRLWP